MGWCRQPPAARLYGERTESALGRGHYVRADLGRLSLAGRHPGRVRSSHCGLGDSDAPHDSAPPRCARDGPCPASSDGCHSPSRSRLPVRIQLVVATPRECDALRNCPSASAGVLQASVLRGLVLSASATAARASMLCGLRSVPFGKYCRSSPFVFSFVPRCQGLWGSQKYTCSPVSMRKRACCDISAP
jgi:hypothetical protein